MSLIGITRDPNLGYDIRVLDGRLVVNGIDCDDLIDDDERQYTQRSGLPRRVAIALAFKAGRDSQRLNPEVDATAGEAGPDGNR